MLLHGERPEDAGAVWNWHTEHTRQISEEENRDQEVRTIGRVGKAHYRDTTKVERENSQTSPNVEIPEVCGMFPTVEQDARDQKTRKHEKQIHSQPAVLENELQPMREALRDLLGIVPAVKGVADDHRPDRNRSESI